MKGSAFLMILFAAASWGAGISGTWQLSYVRESGQTHVSTLTFKEDDGKISGTLSSPLGNAPVSDVKVTGNDISFLVVRRAQYDDITVSYSGKIEGDTMHLSMQYSGRPAVSITAKRQATP